MSKGRPRTRVAIGDPARLAKTIRGVVEANFDGRAGKAARAFGIERSLLSRVLSGKAKSLSVRDVSAIRKAVARDEFVEIERALLSQSALDMLNAFDAWVRSTTAQALYPGSLPDTLIGDALRTVPDWELLRGGEYQHLLAVVRAKFPKIIQRFDEMLKRRRHFQARGDLAYVRILLPLVDSVESGLIERRWQDMSDPELRRFIQAGIERESILLDRPPDVQRAQEMAARDPLEFIALYGQQWDPRAFFGRGTHPLVQRWVISRGRTG